MKNHFVNKNEIEEIELPLNFSLPIREGDSSMVYKYSLNEKAVAAELIKQQIIKRKVLKMVNKV